MFDVLKIGRVDIYRQPLRIRLEYLDQLRPHCAKGAKIIKSEQSDTLKRELARYANSRKPRACEGVVVKRAESPYAMGVRNRDWLKLKKNPMCADLAVVGACPGRGKWGGLFGAYLLACHTPRGLKTIGLVGSGFSDLDRRNLDARARRISGDISDCFDAKFARHRGMKPLHPKLVFEVEFQQVQKSRVYQSGYSLRFPVFKKVRLDRTPRDCTTLGQIIRMNRLAQFSGGVPRGGQIR